jgi:lactoylglutathione lyase
MFRRIGAVILLVSNMKRSIRFYRDTLGMDLKQESKDWTEFSTRGTVLALHPAKRKRIKKNNGMLVGFSISDFDDVINSLKKKRVKFYKKPKQEPFGKHAIIQDPDGHLISIVQMPQEELSQIPLSRLCPGLILEPYIHWNKGVRQSCLLHSFSIVTDHDHPMSQRRLDI